MLEYNVWSNQIRQYTYYRVMLINLRCHGTIGDIYPVVTLQFVMYMIKGDRFEINKHEKKNIKGCNLNLRSPKSADVLVSNMVYWAHNKTINTFQIYQIAIDRAGL